MTSGFDPIITMLIQIKNARLSGANSLDLDYSKYRERVLNVLSDWGLLNFRVFKEEKSPFKKLHLEISSDESVTRRILGLRVYSRPGRRLYADTAKTKFMLSKRKDGVVISTSQGVMSIRDAVKKSLGGELLFEL